MRRNLLIGTLLLLHLASAIGIPLHLHYCRGELQHISAFIRMCCLEDSCTETIAEKACCADQTSHCSNTMTGCCDDTTTWIQDDVPAVCLKNIPYSQDFVAEVPVRPMLPDLVEVVAVTASTNQGTLSGSPPLYLLQCSLIYYG